MGMLDSRPTISLLGFVPYAEPFRPGGSLAAKLTSGQS
jgi:hypothetical protein